MRKFLLLLIPLVAADLYKETQDFQYSRTSSDDGEKKGYYGAQSGNMGGNFEVSHNMDGLAQTQLHGLREQVGSQLGVLPHSLGAGAVDQLNSGSVYGSASTRGTAYGMKGVGSGLTGVRSGLNHHSGSEAYDESQREYSSSYGSGTSGQRISGHTGNNYEGSQARYGASGATSGLNSQSSLRETGNSQVGTNGLRYVAGGSNYQTSNSRNYEAAAQHGETGKISEAHSGSYIPVSGVREVVVDSATGGSKYTGRGTRYQASSMSGFEQAQSGFVTDEGHRTSGSVVQPVYVQPGSTVRVVVRPNQGMPIRVPVQARRVQNAHTNVDYGASGSLTTKNLDSSSQTQFVETDDKSRNGYRINTYIEPTDGNRASTTGSASKGYQSSYAYHKEWERHGTTGENVPLAPSSPTIGLVTDMGGVAQNRDKLMNAGVELNSDGHGSTVYSSGNRAAGRTYGSSQVYQENKGETSGFRTGTSRQLSGQAYGSHAQTHGSGYRADVSQEATDQVYGANTHSREVGHETDLSRQAAGHAYDATVQSQGSGYRAGLSQQSGQVYDANVNAQGSNTDVYDDRAAATSTKPKSYQSSYAYHKSWEKHGTPYVIKPARPATLSAGSLTNAEYGENDDMSQVASEHSSRYGAGQRMTSAGNTARAQYEDSYNAREATLGASQTDTLAVDMTSLQQKLRDQMGRMCTDCGTTDGKTKGYSASYSYSAQRSYGDHEKAAYDGQNGEQHRFKRDAYRSMNEAKYEAQNNPAVDVFDGQETEDLGQQTEDFGQQTEDLGQKTYEFGQQPENVFHQPHTFGYSANVNENNKLRQTEQNASPLYSSQNTEKPQNSITFGTHSTFSHPKPSMEHSFTTQTDSDPDLILITHLKKQIDETLREIATELSKLEGSHAIQGKIQSEKYESIPRTSSTQEIFLGQETESLGQQAEDLGQQTENVRLPPQELTHGKIYHQSTLNTGLQFGSLTNGNERRTENTELYPSHLGKQTENLGQQTEDLGQQTEDMGQQVDSFGQETQQITQHEIYQQNTQDSGFQLGSTGNKNKNQQIENTGQPTQSFSSNHKYNYNSQHSKLNLGTVIDENEYFGDKNMQGLRPVHSPQANVYGSPNTEKETFIGQTQNAGTDDIRSTHDHNRGTSMDQGYGGHVNLEHKWTEKNLETITQKNRNDEMFGMHNHEVENQDNEKHLTDLLLTVGGFNFGNDGHTTHSKMDNIRDKAHIESDQNIDHVPKNKKHNVDIEFEFSPTLERQEPKIIRQEPSGQRLPSLQIESQIQQKSKDSDSISGNNEEQTQHGTNWFHEKSFLDTFGAEKPREPTNVNTTQILVDVNHQQSRNPTSEQPRLTMVNTELKPEDSDQQIQSGWDADLGQQTINENYHSLQHQTNSNNHGSESQIGQSNLHVLSHQSGREMNYGSNQQIGGYVNSQGSNQHNENDNLGQQIVQENYDDLGQQTVQENYFDLGQQTVNENYHDLGQQNVHENYYDPGQQTVENESQGVLTSGQVHSQLTIGKNTESDRSVEILGQHNIPEGEKKIEVTTTPKPGFFKRTKNKIDSWFG